MKFSNLVRKALIGASLIGMATTFGGQSAEAATEEADLLVDVTVLPSCLISTLPVNFGSYDPIGANSTSPLDAQGQVQITCADGLPVVVRLGESAVPGAGSSQAAPVRQMTEPGGDTLLYNLHIGSFTGAVWGDTAATGVAATGSGAAQTMTVYGRIPAGQNPTSGDYDDLVVATVEF